jgi:hypothetical protein
MNLRAKRKAVKVQLQGCNAEDGPRAGPFPRFPFLRTGTMRMMGVAAKFDAPPRKKAGIDHRMDPQDQEPRGGKQGKWITFSAISPRVGKRSSRARDWKVISL